MRKNKRVSGSDLAKIDAHVIQPEEYEEIPEWTEEMFDRADLYIGGKLVKRGRPPKEVRAKTISFRLHPEMDAYFRATGKGCQTRINAVLQGWIKRQPQ